MENQTLAARLRDALQYPPDNVEMFKAAKDVLTEWAEAQGDTPPGGMPPELRVFFEAVEGNNAFASGLKAATLAAIARTIAQKSAIPLNAANAALLQIGYMVGYAYAMAMTYGNTGQIQ